MTAAAHDKAAAVVAFADAAPAGASWFETRALLIMRDRANGNLRPHPEERRSRVSKDGRESVRCRHPSRRGEDAAPQDEVGMS